MSWRLDWNKAKSDKLKGLPSEPADVDMVHEPEHQDWWLGKSRKQRAASKAALEKQMAEAFGRDGPVVVNPPTNVISPKIRALLAELEAARRRREQRFNDRLRRGKKPRVKTAKRKA
jgi:hypothetical protein